MKTSSYLKALGNLQTADNLIWKQQCLWADKAFDGGYFWQDVIDSSAAGIYMLLQAQRTRYSNAQDSLRKKFRAYIAKRAGEIRSDIARKRAMSGTWVHVINPRITDWVGFYRNFCNIQGEVCVSFENDTLYHTRKHWVGFKIVGKTTALFAYDCYSVTNSEGKRISTHRGGSHRHEGWLVPKDCAVTSLVTNKASKWVMKVARELNLPVSVV
jgi:hypothetical protein